MNDAAISESVQNYYGEVLKSSKDLKTNACCTLETIPYYLRQLLKDIHPEVSERYYGCGSPLPPALDGCTVLDLGCGSGRDCYLLSRLVGESGQVIGIDMTEQQLEIANRFKDWHAQRFHYKQPNVSFKQGYMEDLKTAGISDNSIDLVVSNCVINLSPDKNSVLSEIFRVLKPGGELYFSDVYADRRIPENLKLEPVLLGECLAGALYWQDFRRMMMTLGCPDIRIVKQTPIAIEDEAIAEKIGMVKFQSITTRIFKTELEDRCEDFGQIATYQGTIDRQPHAFDLDDHHHFETGKPMRICGNTADMLAHSRYARHFNISGDKSRHFGLFDCVDSSQASNAADDASCC